MALPKTFCVYPWVHIHLNTEGDVFPCCVGWTPDGRTRLGYIKDKSLEVMFNSDYMKQLRLDMLNGVPRPDSCSSCYHREDAGFSSARQGANKDFKNQIEPLIASTASDGFLEPKIKSWDIRFSNLCNYKCRTCGSTFSTSWGEESNVSTPKIYAIPEGMKDPLISQYEHVEKIYFAGGEPLIMPEHFALLQKLIDHGRAHEIVLVYNSNISRLHYRGVNLIELWSKFKYVTVGISLDAVGERAEYIRKGTNWATTENNLKTLREFKQQSTNFDYFFSPTISIFNAYHISDMHKYLVDQGYATAKTEFLFNILLDPSYYSCHILPSSIRQTIIDKITEYVKYCKTININDGVINNLVKLIEYLTFENDAATYDFQNITKRLDSIRNEEFNRIFPEYTGLLNE